MDRAVANPGTNEVAPDTGSPLVHTIRPVKGWARLDLGELWSYRELLFFMVWRDIKVRYKQTVLGAAWAILQPLFTMLVFTLFFGRLAGIPSDGVPYALFAFAALVPWTFFANALLMGSTSVVENANLIKKVYFPRLIVPFASVLAGTVDFLLAFVVLLALMASFGVAPTANIVWVPAFFTLALITALGVGLWLAAMNVQFRDVRYAIPFLTQLWMFSTPVVYPTSLITDPFWKMLYGLNPMVGVVEGFRWALLGTESAPGPTIAVSAVGAVLLAVTGLFYFRRLEKTFVDVV
ncbi:MAG: ABC transporter permease [Planctomycetota bacterium]